MFLVLSALTLAQVETRPHSEVQPSKNPEPPRSTERGPNDSSSKDNPVDLSRPAGDAAAHPDVPDDDDVGEMHTYDPHRADKAIEVGQFYYKVDRNYPAAISRFCEALDYKPNDAIATFWLAQSLDKAGDLKAALEVYKVYLRILPGGPYAAQSKKAIERINAKAEQPSKKLEQRLGCRAAATLRQPAGQPLATSPSASTTR